MSSANGASGPPPPLHTLPIPPTLEGMRQQRRRHEREVRAFEGASSREPRPQLQDPAPFDWRVSGI